MVDPAPRGARVEGLISGQGKRATGPAIFLSTTAHTGQYTEEILLRSKLLWGEGFLSPGGPGEAAELVKEVEIADRDVLDFGSGLGGIDLLLAREHRARRVLGVDVEPELVERAAAEAVRAGLEDRVRYRLVEPGPLELDPGSFDVVFSKDSINHVDDKAALFSDLHRDLRDGGWFVSCDWLRGPNPDQSVVRGLYRLLGLEASFDSLPERVDALRGAGFPDPLTRDRTSRFAGFFQDDCIRLAGPLKDQIVALVGEERHRAWLEIRRAMHRAMTTAALAVHFVRARKPAPLD